MKVSEVKKLIGKTISWEKSNYGTTRHGIVLYVRGKNVYVDQLGSTDWLWLPDMISIKEVQNEF